MKINRNHINTFITKYNIHTSGKIKNDWLEILCPSLSHNDQNYGNAGINLITGKINCFSCGLNKNIIDFLKDIYNYSFKEAMNFLEDIYTPSNLSQISAIDTFPKKEKIKKIKYDFTFTSFNPQNFYYTRIRGFTKEFCDKFNIVYSISNKYTDYFIIPIVDTAQDIFLYEARKLMEYEYLCKHFNNNSSCMRLKALFKKEKKLKGYIYKDFKVFDKNKKKVYDPILQYILQKKVLYPANSNVNITLWNIDNLNYDEDLYVVEGTGSIPKIYLNISKNVTCIFGSNITLEQIEILKKFNKRIILIPDMDIAGIKMTTLLHAELFNLYIIDLQGVEDTNNTYIKKIVNTKSIPSNQFLTKYLLSSKF